MAPNDGALHMGGVQTLQGTDEGVCPHDIQGCYSEDVLWVLSGQLVALGSDGHGAVDGIGDDAQLGSGAHLGNNEI